MFIIDDLVLLPLQPIIMAAEKIKEMIDHEMFDEGRVKEKLMQLQIKLDMGEIGEEEYTRKETELLEWLDMIIKSKEPTEEEVMK